VVYDAALERLPAFRRSHLAPAEPGSYLVQSGRGRSGVHIPEWLPPIAAAPGHDLGAVRKRGTIAVTRQELLDTARWAEQREGERGLTPGNWVTRLTDATISAVGDDGRLFGANADEDVALMVDGMFHMVGMVGAGKSTLMDLLCIWAARRALHITVVVGDVTALLRKVTYFQELGLSAAPVVGQSNRPRHVERLHRLTGSGDGRLTALLDPAFDLIGTGCPLDGLREHDAKPWELRRPPCRSLTPTDTEDERARFGCPLWHQCPRHQSTRELVEASIWVTTTASLVYSQLPTELNTEQVRYLEAAWRRSDLIIVDEADQVQAQLDSIFSPSQTLIGPGDAWLYDIVEHTNRQLKRTGRAVQATGALRQWVATTNNAKAAVDLMYSLLQLDRERKKPVLQGWIDDDYFTGWTLSQRLAQAWAGFAPIRGNKPRDGWDTDPLYQHLRTEFDAFIDGPFGDHDSPLASELSALSSEIMRDGNDDVRFSRVKDWLTAQIGRKIHDERTLHIESVDTHTARLEFTLAVAILSDQLQDLLSLWRQVEADLELEGSNPLVFHRPPRDLQTVVPSTPMGGILGFQYRREDEERHDTAMGELRFFRCEGVGRWVLTHLHDLFAELGDAQANILLMSGTSWAGTSPRYHIDVPVKAVLRPRPEHVEVINTSAFEYLPLYVRTGDEKAITVSGHYGEQRAEALAMIARALSQPRAGGRSILEEHRDQLEPGRRRVLLLTGSYTEAKAVARELANVKPSWQDQIRYMVPDDEEFTQAWDGPVPLPRGEVAAFKNTGAWIMVAPLLAVERGHNILNDENVAAIGAAYFLIRPHPRPDDLTYVTQRLNQWALKQITLGLPTLEDWFRTDFHTAGRALRHDGHAYWRDLIHLRMAYTSLGDDERTALIWSQLVSIWQVIGRLVRGGKAARVYFCDAAFAPAAGRRTGGGSDVVGTSLILGLRSVLEPYFAEGCDLPDRHIVEALYSPLYQALHRIKGM
jgi:hypothetical protein